MKISGVSNYSIYKMQSVKSPSLIQNTIKPSFGYRKPQPYDDQFEVSGWNYEFLNIAKRTDSELQEMAYHLQNLSDEDIKEVTLVRRFYIFANRAKSKQLYEKLKGMIYKIRNRRELLETRKAKLQVLEEAGSKEYKNNNIKLHARFLDIINSPAASKELVPSVIVVKAKSQETLQKLIDEIKTDYRTDFKTLKYNKENPEDFYNLMIKTAQDGEAKYNDSSLHTVIEIDNIKALLKRNDTIGNKKMLAKVLDFLKDSPKKYHTTILLKNSSEHLNSLLEKNPNSILTLRYIKGLNDDQITELKKTNKELDELAEKATHQDIYYTYKIKGSDDDDDDYYSRNDDEPSSSDEAFWEALERM